MENSAKQYTYYGFWDDLCGPDEYDNYRMGPDGLEFQVKEYGELIWLASGFADMDDLLSDARKFGEARYWEINVD